MSGKREGRPVAPIQQQAFRGADPDGTFRPGRDLVDDPPRQVEFAQGPEIGVQHRDRGGSEVPDPDPPVGSDAKRIIEQARIQVDRADACGLFVREVQPPGSGEEQMSVIPGRQSRDAPRGDPPRGVHLAVADQADTRIGAHPHASVRLGQQGTHEIVREDACPLVPHLVCTAVVAVQSPVRSDPDISARIFRQAGDDRVGKGVLRGQDGRGLGSGTETDAREQQEVDQSVHASFVCGQHKYTQFQTFCIADCLSGCAV